MASTEGFYQEIVRWSLDSKRQISQHVEYTKWGNWQQETLFLFLCWCIFIVLLISMLWWWSENYIQREDWKPLLVLIATKFFTWDTKGVSTLYVLHQKYVVIYPGFLNQELQRPVACRGGGQSKKRGKEDLWGGKNWVSWTHDITHLIQPSPFSPFSWTS